MDDNLKEFLKDDEFYKSLNKKEKNKYEYLIKDTIQYKGFLITKAMQQLMKNLSDAELIKNVKRILNKIC